MNKSVTKIKDVVKINKPIFNEKYKVWVVRLKTKTSWKAIWRKSKDDSTEVYEYLFKKVGVSSTEESENLNVPKVVDEQKMTTTKPKTIFRMFSKAVEEEKEAVVEKK